MKTELKSNKGKKDVLISGCRNSPQKLSKPNNNHNPKNKTTKTVVGLRLSNHWEPYPDPKNSPLGPQKVRNDPKCQKCQK